MNVAAAERDAEFIRRARFLFAAEPEREEWRAARAILTAQQEAEARGQRPRGSTMSALRRELLAACVGWEHRELPDLSPRNNLAGLRLTAAGGEIIPAVDLSPDEETGTFDIDREPGLLGEIARWSQTYAYRPVSEFAQPAALATLAAVFGRRWATPTGLGLNLYLVGLGETTGGKDALMAAPRALLSAAGFERLVGKGDFASDSAIEKQIRTKPAHLMPLDEFGKLIQAMMGRNAPTFARLAAKALLEIYPRSSPGSAWTGKARAGDEHDLPPIYSPTLSLLGVSTLEGFFDGMSQAALEDGFLNRLTVVRGGKAGERQRDPARLTPPKGLLDAIRAARAPVGGNLVGAPDDGTTLPDIRFARWVDEAAVDALAAVEAWEDDARDSGRAGVAGRAAEHVQKVATLRALSRSHVDPAVSEADIAWAWEFVRTSIETIEVGAREMMAGSDFEMLVQAVERAALEAGPDGLQWSKLLERRGVGKHMPRMVEAAVERLVQREVITVGLMTGAKGGRPGKRIRAKAFG